MTSYRQEMDERNRERWYFGRHFGGGYVGYAELRQANPRIHYHALGEFSRIYYGSCTVNGGCQCNKDGASTSTQDGDERQRDKVGKARSRPAYYHLRNRYGGVPVNMDRHTRNKVGG